MRRLQQHFHALGSEVLITLIAADEYPFEDTFTALRMQITAFETRFSRFLPDSELTKFNEKAGKETEVSKPFRKLLLTSKSTAKTTNDLYNPFVLPALQKAGYKGSWPSPADLAGTRDFSDRAVVPSAELHIFTETAKIPAGTALDFGGIGKGYLLDELTAVLQSGKLHGYWVSLGGDIVCAGHDLEDQPWSIQVQHATLQAQTVATITNETGNALYIATSGTTKRRGTAAHGSWHHIINPQTGRPAITDLLTATVTADSGVTADVYAKTIVIAGRDYAAALKRAGELHSYILQYKDEEATIDL